MPGQNFLDPGLPATIDGQQQQPPAGRRSLSRPASRGPVSPAGAPGAGGRQQHDQRSMTLPARGRQSSQDLGHRDSVILMDSFDSDNSPRTRTSKSGLHEDSQPVPPSPAPTAQQQNIQNNIPDPSLSSHKDFTSHRNYRGTSQSSG